MRGVRSLRESWRRTVRRPHGDMSLIGEVMAPLPVAHWEARVKAVGVPCSPINPIDRVVAEEQVRARDMVVQIELPGLGPMRMAGLPLKFSETPGRVARHPPRLGQHTAAVMRRLGYADEAIEDLAAAASSGSIPAGVRSRRRRTRSSLTSRR